MGRRYHGGKAIADPKGFGLAVTSILRDYCEEVALEVTQITTDIANEAVKKLSETSPESNRNMAWHYKDAWKKKNVKFRYAQAVRYKIYNKSYRITHLLEHGHATRDGGRVKAIPHIKPVDDWIKKELPKRVKEAIENI